MYCLWGDVRQVTHEELLAHVNDKHVLMASEKIRAMPDFPDILDDLHRAVHSRLSTGHTHYDSATKQYEY
jgi:hypothetical protein